MPLIGEFGIPFIPASPYPRQPNAAEQPECGALKFSLRPNLELANASLREALATLKDGQKPLVHSDQGFQYQHNSWRTLLADAGAVQSMSRKANCYDNAVMENFFGHLKEELFHRVRFLNTDALATALHEYMRWYNTERISTKLNGLSPVQYRVKALVA